MADIPDGKYRARAKQWGFGVAGTGTTQFGITFELAEGGEAITWYGHFNTEENGRRALKAMRTCGWDESDPDILNPKGLDKNEVELVIEGEEYNGRVTPKVKWVNALGGSALKPVPEEQRAALAANIKQWMKPANGTTSRAPARRPQPASRAPVKREGAYDPGPPDDMAAVTQATLGDDDIPF